MSDKPSETLRRIAHGLEIRKGTVEAGIPLPHADLMISQLRQIADRLESDPDAVDAERTRRLRETEDALVRARAMIDRMTLAPPGRDVFERLANTASAAEHARSYALTARHELARRDPEAWRLVARELIDADLDVVRAGLEVPDDDEPPIPHDVLEAWARDCRCCSACNDSPCGGVQQGGPCDEMPCRCEDYDYGDYHDDEEDYR